MVLSSCAHLQEDCVIYKGVQTRGSPNQSFLTFGSEYTFSMDPTLCFLNEAPGIWNRRPQSEWQCDTHQNSMRLSYVTLRESHNTQKQTLRLKVASVTLKRWLEWNRFHPFMSPLHDSRLQLCIHTLLCTAVVAVVVYARSPSLYSSPSHHLLCQPPLHNNLNVKVCALPFVTLMSLFAFVQRLLRVAVRNVNRVHTAQQRQVEKLSTNNS